MENSNTTPTLQHFKDRAISAHNWTSFSPEKRGESVVNEFSAQLGSDIAELFKGGADEEQIKSYRIRYEQYFSSWLGAKSRCISSMITGPAKFPVRRAEKANQSEENHYNVFQEWRKRAKKAIIRKAQPPVTFQSELQRYEAELAGMKKNHELMKACNVIIKKAKGISCVDQLVEAGLSEKDARAVLVPDWGGRIGFPTFKLTNNLANMKRVEDRIALMKKKDDNANTIGSKEFPFDGGKVIYNHEADRIQIRHDEKPPVEVRKTLGDNGFKWAPSQNAWQRNLNSNGIWAAKRALGIELPSL